MAEDPAEVVKTTKKSLNDIRPLKSIKQLDNLQLDINSPRFIRAMDNIGFELKQFTKFD